MVACLKSQTLTDYRCVWLHGTLQYVECNCNKIVQDVWPRHISPATIRAPTNLQTYLKDRILQVSVQWSYRLFWKMHTALSITQMYKSPIRSNKTPYCLESAQPIGVPSHTTMEIYVFITMTHTILAICSSWVGAYLCPVCQIFPIRFHCTMFRRLCCFCLITVLENFHSDTLCNIKT